MDLESDAMRGISMLSCADWATYWELTATVAPRPRNLMANIACFPIVPCPNYCKFALQNISVFMA